MCLWVCLSLMTKHNQSTNFLYGDSLHLPSCARHPSAAHTHAWIQTRLCFLQQLFLTAVKLISELLYHRVRCVATDAPWALEAFCIKVRVYLQHTCWKRFYFVLKICLRSRETPLWLSSLTPQLTRGSGIFQFACCGVSPSLQRGRRRTRWADESHWKVMGFL